MNDAYEIVETHWPYDGPHSDETVATAATAAARLARYMANATQRRPESGASMFRIVSNLSDAVSRLDQVLAQLAEAASGRIADDPSIYDDRHDRPGADTASEAAILLRIARDELADASKALRVASAAASHLGNQPTALRRG